MRTTVRTASDAMIRHPTVDDLATTVADARRIFADDHVHAVLLVDGPMLVAVLDRDDLHGCRDDRHAWTTGRLDGRTVPLHADLSSVHRDMLDRKRRRLAVVDARGSLAGLLCLKRSGDGFCTDDGVAARAASRYGEARVGSP